MTEREFYKKALSPVRLFTSTVSGRTTIREFASDRSRIVYSPAFRRLQQKAQVFSLVENAAVRSRLTHSLEVADIGRLIADAVATQLEDKEWIESGLVPAFVQVVENSCLMHDIGNPPFGHLGEAAIQDWFRNNWEDVASLSIESEELEALKASYLQDFLQFDGNPQGLRIVTRLQGLKLAQGMNLTCSQLLAFIKYLRDPNGDPGEGLHKKPGYFATETDLVESARKTLVVGNGRHPAVYLMEAADDASYCVSDIEDGIEQGVITAADFFYELAEEWSAREDLPADHALLGAASLLNKSLELKPHVAHSDRLRENFYNFKAEVSRALQAEAARLYVLAHDQIMTGSLPELFSEEEPVGVFLKCLKVVATKRLFRSLEAEKLELAGYHMISGLLDHFSPLLRLRRNLFQQLVSNRVKIPKTVTNRKLQLERRLFDLLPPAYVEAYNNQLNGLDEPVGGDAEWGLRAHLIVDFISGMTDDFALRTHQLLSGIDVH